VFPQEAHCGKNIKLEWAVTLSTATSVPTKVKGKDDETRPTGDKTEVMVAFCAASCSMTYHETWTGSTAVVGR